MISGSSTHLHITCMLADWNHASGPSNPLSYLLSVHLAVNKHLSNKTLQYLLFICMVDIFTQADLQSLHFTRYIYCLLISTVQKKCLSWCLSLQPSGWKPQTVSTLVPQKKVAMFALAWCIGVYGRHPGSTHCPLFIWCQTWQLTAECYEEILLF